MKILKKINFIFILLSISFLTKSQDLQINDLIKLKRGNVQLISNNYIGKGWTVSSTNIPFEGVYDKSVLKIQYNSKSSNTIESTISLDIFKDQSIASVDFNFNSEDNYSKIINSINSVVFDNHWTEVRGNQGIINHYEKDEIHIQLQIFTPAYANVFSKFRLRLNNDFPSLFEEITSEALIKDFVKYSQTHKSMVSENPKILIYYKELKVGGEIREYDRKLKIDRKTNQNKEFSISGPDGISVVVQDGLIKAINQRKKIVTN